MSYTIKLQSAPEETATYWIETTLEKETLREYIRTVNEPDIYFHELAERITEHEDVETIVRVDNADFTVKIK